MVPRCESAARLAGRATTGQSPGSLSLCQVLEHASGLAARRMPPRQVEGGSPSSRGDHRSARREDLRLTGADGDLEVCRCTRFSRRGRWRHRRRRGLASCSRASGRKGLSERLEGTRRGPDPGIELGAGTDVRAGGRTESTRGAVNGLTESVHLFAPRQHVHQRRQQVYSPLGEASAPGREEQPKLRGIRSGPSRLEASE